MIKISLVLCIGFVAMHGMEEENNKKSKYEHNNELENIKKPKITISYNELVSNATEQLQNFIKNKSLLNINNMSYEHHKEFLLSQSNIEKVAFLLLLMINDYNDMALKIVQDKLVDINWQDDNGNTVAMLYLFIHNKPELEVFKSLISNENIKKNNKNHSTVLMIACEEHKGDNVYDEIIKFLVNNGAGINIPISIGKRLPFLYLNKNESPNLEVFTLLMGDKDVDTENITGNTLLLMACSKNKGNYKNDQYDEIIKYLIGKGANIDLQNNKKTTALMEYILYSGEDEPNLEILKTLISKKNINMKDKDGDTALHIYLERDNIENEIVELLVHKDTVNLMNAEGYMPITNAYCFDHNDTIGVLVKKGADINLPDDDGKTVLMISFIHLHQESDEKQKNVIIEAIKKLLIYGADPDASDAEGKKATTHCSHKDILKLSKQISNYNNNVNQGDKEALHKAIHAKAPYFNVLSWLKFAIFKKHPEQIDYCNGKGLFDQAFINKELYDKGLLTQKYVDCVKYYLDNIEGYAVKTVLNQVKNDNDARNILYMLNFSEKSIPEEYSTLLEYTTQEYREKLLCIAKERNDKKFGKKIIAVNTAIKCLQAKGYPSELALKIASYI